ncbi:hypothetical protein RJ639_027429 [Escallonia herrerae]|uniref:Uncharacterized protein n=1 Tax=Escallonia herrerae TaxID=1293975 RepID=A0AA88X5E9_9ASTE|nr:hypothetical protein RJ639_027429 [Escallonia herrerae]
MSGLVARTGRHQQRYEGGCRLVAGSIVEMVNWVWWWLKWIVVSDGSWVLRRDGGKWRLWWLMEAVVLPGGGG